MLFPKTTCESRILKRAVLGEFGELDQARLKRQKIDAGIRWIIHQQYSPLRYGAPIVNDQGSLVAMNTGFRTGNKHDMLSIPSSELLKFKNSADDTVKPLPIAGSEKIPVASNALPTGNKEPHSQSAESDVDLVEKLSRLGKDCEIFGWLPQTENDETTFRDFISTFVALKQILDDEQESESFDSIKAKLDDWQNKIDASLGSEGNLDRDQQETFNQRFADVAKKNDDSFVGFVYVKFAALESPMIGIEDPNEKRETISLEFKGTEVSIITNVDPSWRPMPPDSPWLIIGRRLGGTVRIVDRDNNRESFHMTKVMTVIQSN